MNIKISFKIALIMVTATLASCKGNQPLVDPTVRLAYEIDPNVANTENLAKAYSSAINNNRKTGVNQAAIYSDYAVALVGMGRRAEANSWFNKEMNDYPSSRQYVLQLKKLLIPEYQNNTSINFDNASLDDGTAPSLPPAVRSAAEERAASVMEEKNKELDAMIGDENENEDKDENENEDEKE